MYRVKGNRWILVKSSVSSQRNRVKSPRMDENDPNWTSQDYLGRLKMIKDLKIDDNIDNKFFNLSGKVGDNEVRFAYIFPNRFETNEEGINYTFDLFYTDEDIVVPYGTDIWVNISNEMDRIGVPYVEGQNFTFVNFEETPEMTA